MLNVDLEYMLIYFLPIKQDIISYLEKQGFVDQLQKLLALKTF